MNRRLTTALASAALIAFISTPAGLASARQQTEEQGPPARTGQKVTKEVAVSCPVHPDVKARTAGKCPKCRMEERKQKSAQGKKKVREQQPQEETGANE